MDISELIERAPAFVSVIAALGILLLLPLYLSQRRDVKRLRAWMEREPDHPAADITSSEALLDRAETELEELLGETGEDVTAAAAPAAATEVAPAAGATPATPLPAAARVTSERPALERITMERAALAPHPRWRRFAARATQPRVLVLVGIAALLLAVGGIVASEALLSDDGAERQRVGRVDRSEVTVAVLNGTSVGGLAQTVGSDVKSNGYALGPITSTTPDFAKTTVLYVNGQKPAAQKVARDLGLDPDRVEPIDREARLISGDSDVVVIAGTDRAQP